jgi:hypothetical protein
MSTQSDGSEFGCDDGYEHVLMSVAVVALISESLIVHFPLVSIG